MIRYTHLETDETTGVVVRADGHRVEVHAAGVDTRAAYAYSGPDSHIDVVLDWLAESGALLVRAVCRCIFSVVCALFALLVVAPLVEVLCILGAAMLCGGGAVGKVISEGASGAGAVLYHRSLVLSVCSKLMAAAHEKLERRNTPVTMAIVRAKD